MTEVTNEKVVDVLKDIAKAPPGPRLGQGHPKSYLVEMPGMWSQK